MLSVELAFEVFDDVGAYWFVLTLLGFILLPKTITLLTWSLKTFVFKSAKVSQQSAEPCHCAKCQEKRVSVVVRERKEKRAKLFTFWNFVYLVLSVLFLYMLMHVSQLQGEKLATFNPYEILELEEKATVDQIKKSYRRLSLKYHPDKTTDPEAKTKFILISKAYQTLTDEDARQNYERYGNPDGYHGTSVTIGLPSFLTKKENEKKILLVYVALLVAIPVVVGLWWRKAQLYHSSGVRHDSMALFFSVPDTLPPKQLIKYLSAAFEYRQLVPVEGITNEAEKAGLAKLNTTLKDDLPKARPGEKNLHVYIQKAQLLIVAHILRTPVPQPLVDDQQYILKQSHRLLDMMIEICAYRSFLRPMFAAMELCQNITQALGLFESPLYQLPYITRREVSGCLRHKSHVKTVEGLFRLPPKDRQRILKGLAPAEIDAIDAVARMMPVLDVNVNVEVEGEDDDHIYCGDIVTLKIDLKRRVMEPIKSVSEDNSVDDSDDKADTGANDKELASDKRRSGGDDDEEDKSDRVDEKEAAAATELKATRKKAGEKKVQAGSDDDDVKEDDPENLRWKGWNPNKKKNDDKPAVMAHCPYFPFPKQEQWYVVVIDRQSDRMLSFMRVKSLPDADTLEVRFPAPPESGKRLYEVRVVCDSYIGCDRRYLFKIPYEPKLGEKNKAIQDGDDHGNGDAAASAEAGEGDEEEVEEPGKWYYLGFSSLFELVMTVVLLGLIFVFLFNYLYTRGWFITFARWWQTYGLPVWQSYLQPIWHAARDFISTYLFDIRSLSWASFANKINWLWAPAREMGPVRGNHDL